MIVLTAGATGTVGSLVALSRGQSERTITRHPETADVPSGVKMIARSLSDSPAERSAALSRAAAMDTADTPTKERAGSGSGRKAETNVGERGRRMVTW
jgi:hypothetical protein